MEYFDKDDGVFDEEYGTQKENNVMSSAPPPIEQSAPEITVAEEKEIEPETVEISKQNIINHLKPQENKYWRFSFKNEANINRLKSAIESIPEYGLTVDFGVPQNTPDITIKQGEKVVGKINLLLCDRRDANLPEKYYCKIYFYHFKNSALYQAVKSGVVNLFESFKGANRSLKEMGGKRNKKRGTVKRKRNLNKKKSMKRK
jgi:hypothetical protein